VITCARLAGFFSAHAIWCVSDGSTLIPMLGHSSEGGERAMKRFVADDLREAVEQGKARLETNDMKADDAALLYDGRITLGGEKVDAILIEMRAYFSPASEIVMAVPYTPPSAAGFRVHRPKILSWRDCDDFDQQAVVAAFFEGVDAHEQGSKVWNAALDQSK